MQRLIDPILMPGSRETPFERLEKSLALADTPGQRYVEKRGIPVTIAREAGVRFDFEWNGRQAVLAPMRNMEGELRSLHGRYLSVSGKQNKMFTIGPGGGIFRVGDGWDADPIILVEGLFDALSLAACGFSALATVGRIAPWLPGICEGRMVMLAFDGNHPGESEASYYKGFLTGAQCHRMAPPGKSKDWNTALLKQGAHGIQQWVKRVFRTTPIPYG
jgi:hypothetical protein